MSILRGPSPRDLVRHYLSSASAASLWSYAIPFLLIAPSLIWIALDDSAWGGDASQYGHAALELFNALQHSLTAWGSFLFQAFPSKPNGLIWIGQFFVPLAYVTASVDTALLFSVTLIQALSLMLMYRSIRALSGGTVLAPLIGCLGMASAPAFIQSGHMYLVESLQTLSVTWFILIMTFAPTWSRALILSQLLAASVLAMLAKEIQPIFCLGPAILALGHALRPRTSQSVTSSSAGAGTGRGRSSASRSQRRRDRVAVGPSPRVERPASPDRFATRLTLAVGLPLAVVTLAWYVRNFGQVTQHVVGGAFAPEVGTVWGKNDTYLSTIWFWVRTARDSFSLPWIWGGWMLIIASGTLRYALTFKRPLPHSTLCSAAAALQVVTVLLAFAVSPTRQTRFLLPVLPYIALLVAWSVEQLRHRFITVDPNVYPPPRRPFNQVLSEQNFPVLLDTVRTSGLFVLEPPLREDPGILIFQRRP